MEYTSDPGEKRRLQELCSRQGSDDYAKYIREPSLSLLDIFNHFRSCCPPVERIIGTQKPLYKTIAMIQSKKYVN